MKKIINLILSVAFILNLLPVISTVEATNTTVIKSIVCSTEKATAGDTFLVIVNTEDRNDISGGFLYLFDGQSDLYGELEKVSNTQYVATYNVTDSWLDGDYSIKSIDIKGENDAIFTWNKGEEESFDNFNLAIYGCIKNDPGLIVNSIECSSSKVTAGDKFSITVNIEPRDDITNATAYIRNDNDQIHWADFEKISDSQYKAEFKVTSDWIDGEYYIGYLEFGNEQSSVINSEDCDKKVREHYKDIDNITVYGCVSDANPPVFKSIKCSTTKATLGDKFSIIVNAEDESEISGTLGIDNGDSSGYSSELVKIADGQYKATFEVDANRANGIYKFGSLNLSDQYGNKLVIDSENKDKYDVDTFSIYIDGCVQDTSVPVVKSIKCDSKTVTVGDTFSVIVNTEDETECGGTLGIYNADYGEGMVCQWVEFKKVSDNKYKAEFTVTSSWLKGKYKFRQVEVLDKVGHSTNVDANDKITQDGVEIDDFVITVTNPGQCEHKFTKTSAKKANKTENGNTEYYYCSVCGKYYSDPYGQSEIGKDTWIIPATGETTTDSKTDNSAESGNNSSTCPSAKYTDVNKSTSNWTHNPIDYCLEKKYMSGTSDTTFNPDGTVSRAMVVQVLYAMEGKPTVSTSTGYKDVSAGKWYANAVNWAAANGVASGYTNGNFGVNDSVKRQDLMLMLMKYAKYKGYDTNASGDISIFADQSSISKYAITAMQWGVGHNLISGISKNGNRYAQPKATATRAQLAVILKAFDEKIKN